MAGTLLVEVRKALTDALDAMSEFDGVRVGMTWKASTQKREQVFTTNARFTHSPASLAAGRTKRNEVGRFNLVFLVTGVNRDATWSASRAVELGTLAEEWVSINRTMGGDIPGLNSILIEGDGELTEMYADNSTLAELTYPIKYEARLD